MSHPFGLSATVAGLLLATGRMSPPAPKGPLPPGRSGDDRLRRPPFRYPRAKFGRSRSLPPIEPDAAGVVHLPDRVDARADDPNWSAWEEIDRPYSPNLNPRGGRPVIEVGRSRQNLASIKAKGKRRKATS